MEQRMRKHQDPQIKQKRHQTGTGAYPDAFLHEQGVFDKGILMDHFWEKQAGQVSDHQPDDKEYSKYPDDFSRFHIREEVQHQREEHYKRKDGGFAQISQGEHDQGCKNINDFFLFRIPENKMYPTESAKKRQEFLPVFETGNHLRMDRMRNKKQGDQERKKNIVIFQDAFQDKKQQGRDPEIEQDVDEVTQAGSVSSP
jgi:hypothetical protein